MRQEEVYRVIVGPRRRLTGVASPLLRRTGGRTRPPPPATTPPPPPKTPRWVFLDSVVYSAHKASPFPWYYCTPLVLAMLGVVLLGCVGGGDDGGVYVDEGEACRGKCALFLAVRAPPLRARPGARGGGRFPLCRGPRGRQGTARPQRRAPAEALRLPVGLRRAREGLGGRPGQRAAARRAEACGAPPPSPARSAPRRRPRSACPLSPAPRKKNPPQYVIAFGSIFLGVTLLLVDRQRSADLWPAAVSAPGAGAAAGERPLSAPSPVLGRAPAARGGSSLPPIKAEPFSRSPPARPPPSRARRCLPRCCRVRGCCCG
jgi:hypothetical protein